MTVLESHLTQMACGCGPDMSQLCQTQSGRNLALNSGGYCTLLHIFLEKEIKGVAFSFHSC